MYEKKIYWDTHRIFWRDRKKADESFKWHLETQKFINNLTIGEKKKVLKEAIPEGSSTGVFNNNSNKLGGDSFNGKDLDKIAHRYDEILNDSASGFFDDFWDKAKHLGGFLVSREFGGALFDTGKEIVGFLDPTQAFRECYSNTCGAGGWALAVAEFTPWGKIFSKAKKLRTADDFFEHANALGVSTPRNSAVFYSGPGNKKLADAFANTNNRLTIEMTPGGGWLDKQNIINGANSPLSRDEALKVWDRLSEKFSNGASGNAVGFVKDSWSGSTFNRIEYPALRENNKITNVITGGN